jgi:hypothetical protein
VEILALWETLHRPAPPPRAPATAAVWANPHARARFEGGLANHVSTIDAGEGQEREVRSTPEGIAWFMDGL